MMGAKLSIGERLRDQFDAALEEKTIERKIVPKYVPVGDHTEQEEIFAPT